ncbi:MAG: fibro-slime domain-containing protein [Oscillospiraceae bacterium]|nr:fibro-slime domain-containing protein [Oscillospiraceae bacterium]
MKKHGIGSKLIALLLVLAMVVPMVPMQAFAALGDVVNVDTGLNGNIKTNDTISLPIKILDYEADGMLFEFAEGSAGVSGIAAAKTAADFGASAARDFTTLTSVPANKGTNYFYNSWQTVTPALKTGTYANYVRFTYASAVKNQTGVAVSWNNDNRAGMIIPNDLGGIAMNNARYLVMVYRAKTDNTKIEFLVERTNKDRYQTNNIAGDYTFTNPGTTNWTYAVYDLKNGTGNLKNDWNGSASCIWTTLPIDSTGEWIDIAHIALFANAEQAKEFGEYALTDGSDRGDNRAFGLLRGSRDQSQSGSASSHFTGIADKVASVQQLNTYTSSESTKNFSDVANLGYKLLGTFGWRGIANVGLLESAMGENGYPVYKKDVVDYLAALLQHSLEITERTSDGWKNYRYIKGTASSVYGGTDLATALRNKINKNLGSYDDSAKKNLVGTWAEVAGNITSYYDAAFFMLNSIFVPGSYNEPQDDFDYLVLSAGTDKETGDTVYVFDAGFANTASPNADTKAAINYVGNDNPDRYIQNTSAAGKAHFYYEWGDEVTKQHSTTLNPFLPIIDRNTADGMTKSPYYQDDGVIQGVKKQTTKDTLYQRNFNYALVSEGVFTYYADDELFFEFEGDDDVYLFINNELVMDIGSAHSLDKVRFKLNDYVNAAKDGTLGSAERNAALSLKDGEVYSFKFYYMERHSYGSNMRICTNIRVTDPSMIVDKTAWQDGVQLDFGSIVDKDKIVEYGFAIKNDGEEVLHNLTFTDNNIGVKLDYTNGLTITGSRVYDVNGGTLEASDLTATITHPDYDTITVKFADNNALKTFLEDLTAAGTQAGGGLFMGATVQIRGIGYKLSATEVSDGVFDNTVLVTATNGLATKALNGQDSMRVFVPADPMYYEWAGHDLKVTKDKLIKDVLAAAEQPDNILAGKVPSLTTDNVSKIELVTKAGNAISSDNVKIDGNNDLTINYPTAGSKVFYVTITSSVGTVRAIPVLVNVTSVENSVYVLDYGLDVNLTDNNELFKNDFLTVPGRNTSSSIIAVGSNGAYTPNEITFTQDADGVIEGADGNFTFNKDNQSIVYSPKAFLEAADSMQIAVNVYEEADTTPTNITGALDINHEVEMFKTVTVLPATVVYYEDCFPAITYTKDDKTEQTNSFEKLGSQSNNQDDEYGSDSYYDDDAQMSAGSLTTITIDESGKVAEFTFRGTGFELIGRTNATDSASLTVKLQNADASVKKTIPVITEFDNYDEGGSEEIYQVPVIRVKDLPLDTYTVQISGVPARDYEAELVDGKPPIIPTKLYVDGLRIYQPMGATNENYSDDENGAIFIELRDEIAAGNVAVATYSESNGLTVNSDVSTWTENYDGELLFNEVESVEDYLLRGPNNEVYMTGTYENAAIVFYVKPVDQARALDGSTSLQIAIRAIDETKFFSGIENDTETHGGVNATVKYGTYANGAYSWTTLKADMIGSTEQYYTIDYTKCFYDEAKGAYQVMISVDSGMASFSSLKLVGLVLVELKSVEGDLHFEDGIWYEYLPIVIEDGDENIEVFEYVPVDTAVTLNYTAIRNQMAATETQEPEVEPSEPETEPTEPETEPTEPEIEPTEPEIEPTEPQPEQKPGNNRQDQLKKLLSWLRGWLRP